MLVCSTECDCRDTVKRGSAVTERPEDVKEPLESNQDIADEQPLQIRLTNLSDHEAKYVNVLHVNADRASFQVTFSQFLQPIVTTTHDRRELSEQGFVPARVIARLVFTPMMMEETISLLQQQLDQFRQNQSQSTKGATQGEEEHG